MSTPDSISIDTTHSIRDTCVCLHLQRAARAVARRFDEALKPLGLTNGQFSLLTALNRPEPPCIGAVAALLAMDRTTLTANLKPLRRRGLVKIAMDASDKRGRRLVLTAKGRNLLAGAVPAWQRTHAALERDFARSNMSRLRADLRRLA
jgi:DNA-binding MarR family transcriptional regulator